MAAFPAPTSTLLVVFAVIAQGCVFDENGVGVELHTDGPLIAVEDDASVGDTSDSNTSSTEQAVPSATETAAPNLEAGAEGDGQQVPPTADGGQVTICHRHKTMTVPVDELAGHLAHGDQRGRCSDSEDDEDHHDGEGDKGDERTG